ncbi:MAG: ATP-binding cassette domain-containing protein [Bauldia sp.]|nr:ATP-binding cassette domain-containing protein [Bauldia sp.]
MADAAIIEVDDIARHYRMGWRKSLCAVDGVSLTLRRGETLSLVGESGCGKSTLARLILRLETPDRGKIHLDGEDITTLSGTPLRDRRRLMQMVFQDPYACLDPRMTAEAIVREPLDNYRIGTPEERQAAVRDLLARVGLRPEHAGRYPHELSGGQRQRLGIARALSLRPKVLVADEPVSALDVSIRAQVINLLVDLQKDYDLAILFVSHDIDVVAHVSHRIAVMYVGRIVETGDAADVLARPLHPYTRALLDAVPVAHPGMRRARSLIEGDVPSPTNPPPGCRFHPRCPLAIDRCRIETPTLRVLALGRSVACHLVESAVSPPSASRGRHL